MQTLTTDLLIIGGGINGTGIALDAAGRGLKVILCEKDDLAAATSAASSKLIHGGLRYLEQFDFKLVREALKEREILLKIAPHLVHPLQFILPHDKHSRPLWQIRLGLFLYDHLARRSILPSSGKINLRTSAAGNPLKPEFTTGFHYADCQTDDARLVIANALTAQNHGAQILTRTAFVKAQRQTDYWLIELLDQNLGQTIQVKARAIINAAGPWAAAILQTILYSSHAQPLQLVRGSHIVVPKLYSGDQAYILQNNDQRVVFAIPYQQQFTLIGTTDVPMTGDASSAQITSAEIEYLCKLINYYFRQPISPKDVIWSFSGVRALYDTPQQSAAKMSREYHLELQDDHGAAPILSVLGGKLTTYRALAEHALAKLIPYFSKMGSPWTATKPLYGGNLGSVSWKQYVVNLQQQYSQLPEALIQRYAQSYGTLIEKLLEHVTTTADLGEHFGAGLYQKEVDYLIKYEWVQTVEDIIWRRTKLGLWLTPTQLKNLEICLPKR